MHCRRSLQNLIGTLIALKHINKAQVVTSIIILLFFV